MKIAIIGSGITGLGAAWLLNQKHDVTVFEKDGRIGGHANTVKVDDYPAVDTGFIVYNEWTYPNLIALFETLKVTTTATDMSFGVSIDNGRLEYSSDSLFAQKHNLWNLSYYRMLLDVIRFYKTAPKFLDTGDETLSLGDYLVQHNYSDTFIKDHMLPMAAAIWSMSAEQVASFPAKSFIRFFVNHGLLKLKNRPQWHTVEGGSREYVKKVTATLKNPVQTNRGIKSVAPDNDGSVIITDDDGNNEVFDHVILATHCDQALDLLKKPAKDTIKTLESIPYSENIAYLHTDTDLMPQSKKAWSSWNYLASTLDGRVTVSYWMNKLQPFLPKDQDYFVTLNPSKPPAKDKIIHSEIYHHPQYTMTSDKTWTGLKLIQGRDNIWFCGAWCGYGFHEDGLTAGLAVAESIDPDLKRPWSEKDKSPAGDHARPQ